MNFQDPGSVLKQMVARFPVLRADVSQDQLHLYSQAVLTLAQQLEPLLPVLPKDRPLVIYVADADECETFALGGLYGMLNALLGVDRGFEIHLLCRDHDALEQLAFPTAWRDLDPRVRVYNQEIELHTYIERHGYPDVVVFNAVLFDEELPYWFDEHDVIRQCLRQGVHVVGSSMGGPGYQYEEAALSSVGVSMQGVTPNTCSVPFYRGDTEGLISSAAARAEIFDWGRYMWTLSLVEGFKETENTRSYFDDALMLEESIRGYLIALGIFNCPEDSDYLVYQYLITTDEARGRLVRICGSIYYNLDKYQLWDERQAALIMSGVFSDVANDDDLYLERPITWALLVAMEIYQRYLKQYVQDHQQQGVGLSSD
ncbi:hypothetical protein ACP3V3_16715 [Vibrio sp. PNB22_3_1]